MTVYLVNYSMKFYLSILLLLLSGICFSQEGYLRGTVSDDNGMEMSFVSVFEEETGLSTFTDSSGFYELKLSKGNHTVVFSYLGYTLQAKSINIKNGVVFLDLALAKSTVELKNAEVVGDTRDRAREIMKKVRNVRSSISDFTEDFSVSSYQLINLESILARPSKGDTVIYNNRLELGKTNGFPFADQILELTETIGTTYYKSGKGYKEEILATKTHKGGEIRDDIAREITAGIGLEYGEEVITPVAKKEDVNPWVIIEGSDVYEINFYKNYINLPSLTDKPILSPLASTSAITYKFDYLGTEIIDGVELYVIDVSPLNRFENSFSGTIWFEHAQTISYQKMNFRTGLMVKHLLRIAQHHLLSLFLDNRIYRLWHSYWLKAKE